MWRAQGRKTQPNPPRVSSSSLAGGTVASTSRQGEPHRGARRAARVVRTRGRQGNNIQGDFAAFSSSSDTRRHYRSPLTPQVLTSNSSSWQAEESHRGGGFFPRFRTRAASTPHLFGGEPLGSRFPLPGIVSPPRTGGHFASEPKEGQEGGPPAMAFDISSFTPSEQRGKV